MAKKGKATPYSEGEKGVRPTCLLPPVTPRPIPEDLNGLRVRLIRTNEKKWVNGTHIRYRLAA